MNPPAKPLRSDVCASAVTACVMGEGKQSRGLRNHQQLAKTLGMNGSLFQGPGGKQKSSLNMQEKQRRSGA